MDRIELLSPAGSIESLRAAVQNGADAVYMGGAMFNARRNAKNFDDAQMERAIAYCRLRGVKTYITMNTLLFDRELEDALKYAGFLYNAGADALIVQDLGLVKLLASELGKLPIHASTQMAVHNADGAERCRQLGITRVVLSRETSLERISEISARNTGVELEAFAHGALCMSFSGECLYSSMAGERSGNRGMCAQPCRKRASVLGMPGDRDYCLSPSDMCMLDNIDAMRRAGISCIKLEGRMKRPEYVAAVTRAYRTAIDGGRSAVTNDMRSDVEGIFSRGFSSAYYFGDDVRTDARASETTDAALLRRVSESFEADTRKLPVTAELYIARGEPVRLTLRQGDAAASVAGGVPQAAKKPQSAELYERQLKKLGDTPFVLESAFTAADENAFVSVGELNAIRRCAVTKLEELLTEKRDCGTLKAPKPENLGERQEMPLISARVRTLGGARAAKKGGADEIIIDPIRYEPEALEEFGRIKQGVRLLLALPVAVMGDEFSTRLRELASCGIFDGIEINNISQLEMCRDAGYVVAGTHMNVTNTQTVSLLRASGVDRVTLSQELTRPQLRDMLKLSSEGITVYGRAVLMNMLHCTVKEHFGCRGCDGTTGAITDEEGRGFELINTVTPSGCIVRMLNMAPTYVIDLAAELSGAAAWTLSFFTEDENTIERTVNDACEARDGRCAVRSDVTAAITRGHWNRAVL